jgi:hypothetical protein
MILVTGGGANSSPLPTAFLSSAEIFDPRTETWQSCGNLSGPAEQHSAVLLGNGQVLSSTNLYIAGGPFRLEGTSKAQSGGLYFGFTNTPRARFTVLTTTNLANPISGWQALPGLVESPLGIYQFNDTINTNTAQVYYRVRAD